MIAHLAACLFCFADYAQFMHALQQKSCVHCDEAVQTPAEEAALSVCMSFSIPLESWKDLSMQLERVNGRFVVLGIPNNSFTDFAEQIITLRMEGVNAVIDIDPVYFTKHSIAAVPAFVLEDKGKSDTVCGNVRVDVALQAMAEKGECNEQAGIFLKKLQEGS